MKRPAGTRIFVRICPAAIVLVTALLGAALPAQAAFPGNNGRIAYVCGGVICTIDPDGSHRQPLATVLAGNDPAWSPDGAEIAFTGGTGNNSEIYVMRADGTALTPLTVNQVADQDPAWSPDGSKIVFTSNRTDSNPAACMPSSCVFDLHVMNADGTQQTRLIPARIDLVQLDPSWDPNGARIAYYCENQSVYRDVCLVNSDGTGRTRLRAGAHPNWLPDGSRIAFDAAGDVFTMKPDGSDPVMVPPPTSGHSHYAPAWAPDGTRFAETFKAACFTPSSCGGNYERVLIRDLNGAILSGFSDQPDNDRDPDWQPVAPSPYPRPVSAPRVVTSLVPAYVACSSSNRIHGPPLAGPSCNPPVQTSQNLTVRASFVGSVRVAARIGNPSTTADEADVGFTLSLTDVRTAGLADYTGDLLSSQSLRLTDRTTGSATVEDLPFSFSLPCTATADTTVGSTCAIATTADTLMPGAVQEGKRAIWQLGQIRVFDGGPDGVTATTPNALFAVQGVFIP